MSCVVRKIVKMRDTSEVDLELFYSAFLFYFLFVLFCTSKMVLDLPYLREWFLL